MQYTQLTEKQRETLDFIQKFLTTHGKSPTIAELRKGLGVSSLRTAAERIDMLEKKGFLFRTPLKHRNISLVNPLSTKNIPPGLVRMPVIASAGCDALQVYAQEIFDEFLTVGKSLTKGVKDLAAIKAIGNSMIDAGIKNNDYVVIEVTDRVSNGDRVVAILGDMSVIKTYQRKGNLIFLNPENAEGEYSPIVVEQSDVKIFGRVLSIISSEEDSDEDYHLEYLQ